MMVVRAFFYGTVSILVVGFWLFVFVSALRHVIEVATFQKTIENLSASGAVSSKSSSSSAASVSGEESQLLPLALDLMRKQIPLDAVYTNIPVTPIFPTHPQNCNCHNPKAWYNCCQRRLARSHKWGCLMSEHLFDAYKPRVQKITEPHDFKHYIDNDGVPDNVDFREVLLLRNIFDSLVSGYLYHKSGRECWISGTGGQLQYGPGWKALQNWHEHLSYDIGGKEDRSICQYMADETEEMGMRAYVDWVFHYYYKGILSHWALAQHFPYLRDRTKTICYEDLGSSERDLQTINDVLTFWYDGKDRYEPWTGARPGKSDGGGHATSKDLELRKHFVQIIEQIDRKYYDGDIKWLSSVLPC